MKTLREMLKGDGWKEGLCAVFIIAFIIGSYFVLGMFQA